MDCLDVINVDVTCPQWEMKGFLNDYGISPRWNGVINSSCSSPCKNSIEMDALLRMIHACLHIPQLQFYAAAPIFWFWVLKMLSTD